MNYLTQLENEARSRDIQLRAEQLQVAEECNRVQGKPATPVYGPLLAATGAILVHVGQTLAERYSDESIEMVTIPHTR